MTSNVTKSFRLKYLLCFFISILLNIGPLAFYSISALINSTLVYQKVTLIMTVLIVVILTAVSLVNKVAMRSRLWILLIGIYVCLEYIMTPLIIIACCQIIDEIIFTPLYKSMRNKLLINKQIDRRL